MLLTPIILFVILMILLYVPPVQNCIRKQAKAIATDATGMNISVGVETRKTGKNYLKRKV